MKRELPILFSTPMVIAIQREVDPKTQTRRIAKGIPDWATQFGFTAFTPDGHISYRGTRPDGHFAENSVKIPVKKGDILYVREAYYAYGYWTENGKTDSGRQKWKFISTGSYVDTFYVADTDSPDGGVVRSNSYRKIGWYKRLARFMPKKYARIKLEVTGIGVERLKDISEEDAIIEGIIFHAADASKGTKRWYERYPTKNYTGGSTFDPRESFFSLWESINGKESLDSNPFVFVIKFRKLCTTS